MQVLLEAFTLTFLAEWGDRSQIATIGAPWGPDVVHAWQLCLFALPFGTCVAVSGVQEIKIWPGRQPNSVPASCFRLPTLTSAAATHCYCFCRPGGGSRRV